MRNGNGASLLPAGRMVMCGSLLCADIALLASMVILEGGIVALVRVADTLSRICLASEVVSLLVLIADFVAVMRSTIRGCGEIVKFRPFQPLNNIYLQRPEGQSCICVDLTQRAFFTEFYMK